MLRPIAERLLRNLLFRRHLKIHNRRVPIFVSPSAGLRYVAKPMSLVDPILVSHATDFVRAGYVVWDIGANIGLFTFSAATMAGRGGRVIAFEPDVWLVGALRRSAAIQSDDSAEVIVVPAAVGKENAIRRFALAKRSRSSSHLVGYGQSQTGGTQDVCSVVTLSVDWSLRFFAPPDVLKIDVEGAELEVLEGAQHVLDVANPVILCEVTAASARAVTDFLRSRGYELYDGERALDERRPLPLAPWSTIAIRNADAARQAARSSDDAAR